MHGGIEVVEFVQDLNDKQILIKNNEVYFVVNKNIVVTEDSYNEYFESRYKDTLKAFKEFISYNNINEEILTKLVKDYSKKK